MATVEENWRRLQLQVNTFDLIHGLKFVFRVKLGYDPLTGEQAAVKIIRIDHPKLNPRHLAAENYALKTLSHPNILKLIEYLDEVDYCKKNGTTYPVVAFALEYAPNGDLWKFLSSGARLEESMARKIFHQLLNVIEYCHNQKFAHRDLKPENILFDKDFNLKLADFGFSISLITDEGKKYCESVVGTEAYMAPELHKKMPYCPVQADLYALAIILFLLKAGTPPFKRAEENDPHFKIFSRKLDLFWKAHEKNKPKIDGNDFFSEEFKTLMNSMLTLDLSRRPSISDIKASAWYQGAAATESDLRDELRRSYGGIQQSSMDEKIVEKEEVKREIVQDKASKTSEKDTVSYSEKDSVVIAAEYKEKSQEKTDQACAEDPFNMSETLSAHVKVMS
mgnify:CR=1 FL=1